MQLDLLFDGGHYFEALPSTASIQALSSSLRQRVDSETHRASASFSFSTRRCLAVCVRGEKYFAPKEEFLEPPGYHLGSVHCSREVGRGRRLARGWLLVWRGSVVAMTTILNCLGLEVYYFEVNTIVTTLALLSLLLLSILSIVRPCSKKFCIVEGVRERCGEAQYWSF